MKKSRASLKQTTASGCSHRCGSGSRMHSSASMQQWRALNFAADGAERLWQSLWEKNETRLNQFLNSCGDYQTKLICINTHSSWIFDITRRCHLHCSTNGAEGNVWLFIFGGWLRDAKGTTIHGALFLFALAPVLPSNRAPSFCHGMPTKSPPNLVPGLIWQRPHWEKHLARPMFRNFWNYPHPSRHKRHTKQGSCSPWWWCKWCLERRAFSEDDQLLVSKAAKRASMS